jgi:hypothetical protein
MLEPSKNWSVQSYQVVLLVTDVHGLRAFLPESARRSRGTTPRGTAAGDSECPLPIRKVMLYCNSRGCKVIVTHLTNMKFAICGPFQIKDCHFGSHLQPAQSHDDVSCRIEVSMEQPAEAQWSFIFDQSSVEYGRGFCRWLSSRSRQGLRATKFTFVVLQESEAVRRVVKSLLDGTTFPPMTQLDGSIFPRMSPDPNQIPTLLPDILQFPQLLKRKSNEEYRTGNIENSRDLYASCIQALSECDKTLELWDSTHDDRTAKWKNLSYDILANLVQINLVQKSDGTVENWIPFEAAIGLTFDDDIKIRSKVRFLRVVRHVYQR